MKRCPQCSFLYLDSDQLCDLDQTPLIADDFGTHADVTKHSDPKAGKISLTSAIHQRKLNLKTLSAAIVAGLVIGLMLLLSYQRMRPNLQASQASLPSQAQVSRASRVSEVAQQVSNEVSTKESFGQPELDSASTPEDITSPSAKASSSSTAKSSANTRLASERYRASANPVSTGDISKPGRGPVTIQLANGSTLQADEVWRTKAGIWYRRKGIVTLLKPNRVRASNK